MKSLLLILFLFCSTFFVFGQELKNTDSLNFYQKELSGIYKKYRDTLNANLKVKELRKNIEKIRAKSDDYRGFVLYSSIASANFDKFNMDNAKTGFGPLTNTIINIGYGFTFKKNRRIFEFNVSALGIAKKTKKNDETIKTSFSNFLQFEWGYDFIKNNKINIYPFAGFGIRSSDLIFENPQAANPNYSNASNIILNNKSFNESATEIGYQAGLGIEYVLTKSDIPGGVILFFKGGTNRPFKRKNFNIAGVNYDPQLNYGDLNLSFGFKFFGR